MLQFLYLDSPSAGELIEVAPGIKWLRPAIAVPPDHVNVYLIEDTDGWTVLDTGLGTDDCRNAWEALLRGRMTGQRLTSMVVTHFHPDHFGLAGWLADRFALRHLMSSSDALSTPGKPMGGARKFGMGHKAKRAK
jgi:glyoxylase-like metal-dependent hydrolase (beta-lactamase superfamily II)